MIRVESLSKSFGRTAAARDVTFEVARGEAVALLGPNGSGKTTVLRCVTGLVTPSSGRVLVGGIDVARDGRRARALMSFLPQRVAFPENLTAREVLDFYGELRHLDRNRIDEVVSMPPFRFNGASGRPVGEFSGGMLQRLGLAVACLADAPILLLDEPTVGLDPDGLAQLRGLLAELKRRGTTIVISSHALADVEGVADRFAIMVDGRLAAILTREALGEEIARSAELRVVLGTPPEQFLEAAHAAGATRAMVDGPALVVACRPEDRPRVLRVLEDAGAAIRTFSTREATLEDVYLRYIRQEDGR